MGLDNETVWRTAEQVIGVVDDYREGRDKRRVPYTLEGRVAEVLVRNIDRPVERAVRLAVNAATEEEAHLRLGHCDPRELPGSDPERGVLGPSAADRLERLLQGALGELRELRSHTCEFGEDDYCVTCRLDGRA